MFQPYGIHLASAPDASRVIDGPEERMDVLAKRVPAHKLRSAHGRPPPIVLEVDGLALA